jgi:predicted acylesterase/phospholipase RssA
MSDALVLLGAVAKGAFSAGALALLSSSVVRAQHGIQFRRVVAASSGALNGVYYANAIRTGAEDGAGTRLSEIWLEHATLRGAIEFNLRDAVAERGFSDAGKIFALLRRYVPPSQSAHPIDLRLVVTIADGEVAESNGSPATTFEHVVDLKQQDFALPESIERVYEAAAASAALPVLYAPVPLRLNGHLAQGLDGGFLNDGPLGLALGGVDRIFVVIPFPRVAHEPPDLRGRALISHLFDMLVRERLFRDIGRVTRDNRVLERLEARVPDRQQRAEILETLGWQGRRPVQVVEIRPDRELPGDAFSGFWSRELRELYIRAGVESAEGALAALDAPAGSRTLR